MLRSTLLTICSLTFLFSSNISHGQNTPLTIIEKSMNYHDPDGLIDDAKIELILRETRPSGGDRHTKVILNEKKEYCKITRNVDGDKIEMKIKKTKAKIKLNGKSKLSKEQIEKYRLTPERAVFMKNYYRYLWLLPKVILDGGAVIAEGYGIDNFFGKTCLEIKVTYQPEVGDDIWYFYFNQDTYALEGYRFYHDEAANDGEYILLSDLTTYQSVKIPKSRKWYTHQGDKFLGEDILTAINIK